MTKKHQALRNAGYMACREGKPLEFPLELKNRTEAIHWEIGWRDRRNEEAKIQWAETIAKLVREMNDRGNGLSS